MAKQGTVSFAQVLSRVVLSTSVLSAALLSAILLSIPAFAGEAPTPSTPSSTASLPNVSNPANNSSMGQMMAMQQAAMGLSAAGSPGVEGNIPKSNSISANFGWMDTFDANALNGGYGGGVTVTHWITSKVAVQASIEIESFGLGAINQVAQPLGLNDQAGTPVIPITLGALYDFTAGKCWVNPQIFADAGPAVTLNGESMPLYVDAGVGVTTPLGRLSDALSGVNIFANIRWAYLSNISGLADTATNTIGTLATLQNNGTAKTVGSQLNNASSAYKGALNYMPIEFGATFAF